MIKKVQIRGSHLARVTERELVGWAGGAGCVGGGWRLAGRLLTPKIAHARLDI